MAWGDRMRGSHKQLPPKPGKWLDDWSLLLALRWKGGDSLKCVRGTRAPGNPEAWIRAEVERSRRRCLGCASRRPPGRPASPRPRPAARLTRSRGARCRFSSSSFASSSSSALFSSSSSSFFSSSSSSSSSFPTSSSSATASSSNTTTTPSGAPGSLQSPRSAPPPLRPPGSRACGAQADRTDGQTDCSRPALTAAAARVGGTGIAPGSTSRVNSAVLSFEQLLTTTRELAAPRPADTIPDPCKGRRHVGQPTCPWE
ncbi:uncharacterized protein LOC105876913 [Microcebus murinus]|uniref:uncharacterized protein LOC105876913 n=1 Tax=Microcebus murinus TaxID=30608 RepID=UPI003F6AE494